jgi:hypothetical protein
MTTFEILVAAGIAIVIGLLVRIEKVLKALSESEDRRDLESEVRDFMPTLWKEPEFRSKLVPWYRRMNDGEYASVFAKQWHWYAIVETLSKTEEGYFRWKMPASEINRLDTLSGQFLHDAESSHLITKMEADYILFYLWNLHFHDPHILCKNDMTSFEEDLLEMRKKYLREQ